jgi:hypothetical protein
MSFSGTDLALSMFLGGALAPVGQWVGKQLPTPPEQPFQTPIESPGAGTSSPSGGEPIPISGDDPPPLIARQKPEVPVTGPPTVEQLMARQNVYKGLDGKLYQVQNGVPREIESIQYHSEESDWGAGSWAGIKIKLKPDAPEPYDPPPPGAAAHADPVRLLNDRLQEIANRTPAERNKVTTVVAGVNTRTGQTFVAEKISGQDIGRCAEDLCVDGLGGDPKEVLMSPAIRPRTGEVVPVCLRCGGKYTPGNFTSGTRFQHEGEP